MSIKPTSVILGTFMVNIMNEFFSVLLKKISFSNLVLFFLSLITVLIYIIPKLSA